MKLGNILYLKQLIAVMIDVTDYKCFVYYFVYVCQLSLSLTCSNVVSFSDSSHQQQQTGAGLVCMFVCM